MPPAKGAEEKERERREVRKRDWSRQATLMVEHSSDKGSQLARLF